MAMQPPSLTSMNRHAGVCPRAPGLWHLIWGHCLSCPLPCVRLHSSSLQTSVAGTSLSKWPDLGREIDGLPGDNRGIHSHWVDREWRNLPHR